MPFVDVSRETGAHSAPDTAGKPATDSSRRATELSAALGQRFAHMEISRSGLIGLALCVLSIWMLEHPYLGLVNDATLYALGAFARVHAGSLGHDIFLSHGSQNGYTIFSPLVAPIMQLLGVGRAAALVTLANQAILFGGCALVARKLMPRSLAILSVALLVALPGVYGAKHIFWFTEPLMTPRVSAEALVMGALACALGRRYGLMTVCVVVGMLLHPIMAVAGIAFLFILFVGLRRPWLTTGLVAGSLGVLAVLSHVAPFGAVATFDPRWFQFLHGRLQYLFPSLWSVWAWGRMAIPSATLVVGALTLAPSVPRRLCCAALVTAILGLGIALVGSDLLHIVIVTQVQTWRWLWLSNALAILLLPIIAAACWRAGATGRATLLLLAAAWTAFDEPIGGLVAIVAVAVAALGRRKLDRRISLGVLAGASAILLACIVLFARSILAAATHRPPAPAGLTLIQSMYWAVASRWLPWARDGVLPTGGFLALWWIARKPAASRSTGLLVVVVSVALCIALGPFAWSSWTNFSPSERMQAQFAPWRRVIPPTAEVYTDGVPLIPWFLLERPSYWSLRQMAGAVFSRPTTMVLLRREYLLHHLHLNGNPERDLNVLCAADEAIGFVVTSANMGPTPFKPIAVADARVGTVLHLYSCSAHRAGPPEPLPAAASSRS